MATCAMYKLRPIMNQFDVIINSPMYKMKNLQAPSSKNDTECIKPPEQIKDEAQNEVEQKVAINQVSEYQDEILKDLKALKLQIATLRLEISNSNSVKESNSFKKEILPTPNPVTHDIIINAHPEWPPYSILAFKKLWRNQISVNIKVHKHSSIISVPKHLNVFETFGEDSSSHPSSEVFLNVRLIWKKVDVDCEMIISPLKQRTILGEVNLIKYIHRLIPSHSTLDLLHQTILDETLDCCYQLRHCTSTDKCSKLIRNLTSYVCTKRSPDVSQITTVDIALWSYLYEITRSNKLSVDEKLKNWVSQFSHSHQLQFGL